MGNRSVGRGLASRTAVAVLAALLTPALAMADRHKAGLGGGGAKAGGSNLWGVTLSGDYVVDDGPTSTTPDGKVQHHIWTVAIAGEVTQVAGEHEGATLSRTTLLVGPRFTFNQIKDFWGTQIFIQALGGRAYERLVESQGSWVGSAGVGVDVPIKHLKDPGKHPVVVGRLQWGYYWIGEGVRNSYNQFTLSVIFRLNKQP
jgi:hypothetical protein